MKSAVIFFHKNIQKIYKQSWIDKCVMSVLEQTYKDFDIFEINYGGEDYSVVDGKNIEGRTHFFYKINYPTHIEAMTFLLNRCFVEGDYDIVFNTNLDDYYKTNRFEEQVRCLEEGYDLCSSLWNYFKEDGENEIQRTEFTFEKLCINGNLYANITSVKEQLNKKNNVINHSGVAFTRKYWNGFDENGNKNRYRDDKPYEDLTFWRRTANNNWRLTVINKNLISYRLHDKQIGNALATGEKKDGMDDGFNEPDYSPKRYGIFILIDDGNKDRLKDFMIHRLRKEIKKHEKKILFIFTNTDIENYKPMVGYKVLVEKVDDLNKENEYYEKLLDVRKEILCDEVIWEKI